MRPFMTRVYFSDSSLLAFPSGDTGLPIALQIPRALMLPAFFMLCSFWRATSPASFLLWKHPSLSECLRESVSYTMPPSLESLLGPLHARVQAWHVCNIYRVEFKFCLLSTFPEVNHLSLIFASPGMSTVESHRGSLSAFSPSRA